jgi:hypothetical protein
MIIACGGDRHLGSVVGAATTLPNLQGQPSSQRHGARAELCRSGPGADFTGYQTLFWRVEMRYDTLGQIRTPALRRSRAEDQLQQKVMVYWLNYA